MDSWSTPSIPGKDLVADLVAAVAHESCVKLIKIVPHPLPPALRGRHDQRELEHSADTGSRRDRHKIYRYTVMQNTCNTE